VLDVGCGCGFPLVELAQRIGPSGRAVGVDSWKAAVERARLKVRVHDLHNVLVFEAAAERLPFDPNTFDLVVSNNGINNVEDADRSLAECRRVARSGAQFVLTYNLEGTMREFYDAFEAALAAHGLHDRVEQMRLHIQKKRKPLEEMKMCLVKAGFRIVSVAEKSFVLRFSGAQAFFNHSLIKCWFLPSWKEVAGPGDPAALFAEIEQRIDASAAESGAFAVTIPYVVVDSMVD
jgi:ubiquinone/menaquinone biosynthesis C-methylase UbiE